MEKRLQGAGSKESAKKSQQKWLKKNTIKTKAHWRIKAALLSGKLKRENCIICNTKKSEAHHEDYGKPLDVIWLCRNHHKELHRNV